MKQAGYFDRSFLEDIDVSSWPTERPTERAYRQANLGLPAVALAVARRRAAAAAPGRRHPRLSTSEDRRRRLPEILRRLRSTRAGVESRGPRRRIQPDAHAGRTKAGVRPGRSN